MTGILHSFQIILCIFFFISIDFIVRLSHDEALDHAAQLSNDICRNHDSDLRGQLQSLLANLSVNISNASDQSMITSLEKDEEERLDQRISEIGLDATILEQIERDAQVAMHSYTDDLESRLAKLRLEMLQKRLRDFDIQACEARDLLAEHKKIEAQVDSELNAERQVQKESLRERVAARKAARRKEAQIAKTVSTILSETNNDIKSSNNEEEKSRALAKAMKLVFSLMRKINDLKKIPPIKSKRARPTIDSTVTEYERVRLMQSHLANVERLDEVLAQEKLKQQHALREKAKARRRAKSNKNN